MRLLLSNFLDKIKGLSSRLNQKFRLSNQPIYAELNLLFRLLGHLANSNSFISIFHVKQMMIETKELSLTTHQIEQAIRAFKLGQQMLTGSFEASLRYSKINDLDKEKLLKSCWRMIWADHYLAVREYQLVHLWGYWLGWSRVAIENVGMYFKPVCITSKYQQALDILNITLDTPYDVIKKNYKRKLSFYHPDKVIGAGGSLKEVIEATEKTAKIHEAYALIRTIHGF